MSWKFYIQLIILAICLISANIFVVYQVDTIEMRLSYVLLHVYFLAISGLEYYLLTTFSRQGTRFIAAFMGALGFKMLFSLSILLIYLLVNKSDAVPFAITFGLLYMAHTFFTTWHLYHVVKT